VKNPYFIDEPACIALSGGRTSAYMLVKILDAHNGILPDYVQVLFANTGKEMPETLAFVNDCGKELGVKITWLELAKMTDVSDEGERTKFKREFKVVDFESASRNGEPFEILINAMGMIPNAVMRSCTGNLKIRVMVTYLKSIGYESPWMQYVGIRGDEQRRAKKIHGRTEEGHETFCPLWVDGVTAKEVGDFWSSMPWDLNLPNNNGVTDWGNCDLCFLKGKTKRASIIRERPDLADWWIKIETNQGMKFRPDEPSYKQMRDYALAQDDMFSDIYDDSIPCFCGD